MGKCFSHGFGTIKEREMRKKIFSFHRLDVQSGKRGFVPANIRPQWDGQNLTPLMW